jgi:hypothetical protein
MDAQPETPAAAGTDVVAPADAYELFWDSFESDAPVDTLVAPVDADAADAYRQFWEMSDA